MASKLGNYTGIDYPIFSLFSKELANSALSGQIIQGPELRLELVFDGGPKRCVAAEACSTALGRISNSLRRSPIFPAGEQCRLNLLHGRADAAPAFRLCVFDGKTQTIGVEPCKVRDDRRGDGDRPVVQIGRASCRERV